MGGDMRGFPGDFSVSRWFSQAECCVV